MRTLSRKDADIQVTICPYCPREIVFPVPPVLWTPALIPLAGWWDASDLDTITESLGSVSQWSDKSGNGRHMVQATAVNQPLTGTRQIGGLNALEFFATLAEAQWLTHSAQAAALFPADKQVHLFCVAEVDNLVDSNVFFMAKDGSPTLIVEPDYRGGINLGADVLVGSSHIAITNGVYQLPFMDGVNCGVYPGSSVGVGSGAPWQGYSMFDRTATPLNATLRVNGGTDSASESVPTPAPAGKIATNVILGGHGSLNQRQNKLDGLLAEVIIFTGTLVTTIRDKIDGYLAWKWGTVASLPADHPYKLAPPTV